MLEENYESQPGVKSFSKHKSEALVSQTRVIREDNKQTISLRAPIPRGAYDKIHFKNIELKSQQTA